MEFESLLDLKTPNKGVTRPAFFLDLNIDQILERITKNDRGILEYFEYFPLDAECQGYRHAVYADIKKNALYDALIKFTSDYNEFRDIENKKKSTRIELQKPVWHFWGMEIYTRCLSELKKALEDSALDSEGFKSLSELLAEYTGKPEFIGMAEKALKLKEALLSLTVIASYENGRIQVSVEDSKPANEKEQDAESEEDDDEWEDTA